LYVFEWLSLGVPGEVFSCQSLYSKVYTSWNWPCSLPSFLQWCRQSGTSTPLTTCCHRNSTSISYAQQIILALVYNCICWHQVQSACTSLCIPGLFSITESERRYCSTVLTSVLNEKQDRVLIHGVIKMFKPIYRYTGHVTYRHYQVGVESQNFENTDSFHATVAINPIKTRYYEQGLIIQ
jgi:hypothetical protein